MEAEVWKPYPNGPAYEVSSFGRVRRVKDKQLLVGWLETFGYRVFHLRAGVNRTVRGHQLVLETFVGPAPFKGAHCRHLDGNPDNNSLSNLAWGSAADNAADKETHGRTLRGESHGMAKLDQDKVLKIRNQLRGGVSQREIAASMGCSQQMVSRIACGKNWREASR